MAKTFVGRKRIRHDFGRIDYVIDMPNLIEVQRNSYEAFLQADVKPEERKNIGLQHVFASMFPIRDFAGKGEMEFVRYSFEPAKYDVAECLERGMTHSAALKTTLRLIVWDLDEATGARSIRDIKEQDVYMGEMPLMTDSGTFIIDGVERVVVSQMHRSPGVFFDHDQGKTHSSGKFLFSARVIPYRGSWLDFEFDHKDILYVRIDRRRKLPVSTMLYCIDSEHDAKERAAAAAKGKYLDPKAVDGMSGQDILQAFYARVDFRLNSKKAWVTKFVKEQLKGAKLVYDLVDAKTGKAVAKAGEKMTSRVLDQLEKDGLTEIAVGADELIGRFSAVDMVNESTGAIIMEAGEELTREKIDELVADKVKDLPTLAIDYVNVGPYMRNTMQVDRNTNREEALIDIYKVMRPGEPPTMDAADALFRGLFFDQDKYDLSAVGRVKMNARLGIESDADPDTQRVLTREDLIRIVRTLLELKDGRGEIDDIDHLGNRRVRAVGEMLENKFLYGVMRMERAIKERMASVDIDTVMPQDLVNAKPVGQAVREFFTASQLAQYMEQINPLAELTHKRRLSALGPGGLTRERAGFEVRDVHSTHYGRICPIETPEGSNIGLINSLTTYAKVNPYGFIETPYRKVKDGKVSKETLYMSALEEGRYNISQANAALDSKGKFKDKFVACRRGGEFVLVDPTEVDLIDVSPKQIVSVAASLIPFLGHDDANRALMGSNMQRQGVPLLRAEAPFVGTGMEGIVARDSGAAVVAKRSGAVTQVDAARIVVKVDGKLADDESGVDIYNLLKYRRSNQKTCVHQRPLVRVGDKVRAGDIVADGPSTELGELALGRNVLVAFMPWNGYNYEDSILISERIVSEDVYTSIHIEEFEVAARDTKLGQEEITRDIPNVGEENLKHLDEVGVVHIGAEVKAGDIMVGKVTPKGESLMTPEEKLLRAIFGEKAADVRDTSLRVPPGVEGTVVEVRLFNRRGVEKDERAKAIERTEIDRLSKDRDDEKSILEDNYYSRLKDLLVGQEMVGGKKGAITAEYLDGVPVSGWKKIAVKDDKTMKKVERLAATFEAAAAAVKRRFENRVEKLQAGDDLMPGVLKMVKVFIATKRKLQPGDKMAGRHGNKGVVSRVLPVEDMPFSADGTPMDIVLNPLGVPSRMNIGQLLETHLGWACKGLGRQLGDMLDSKAAVDSVKAWLLDIYGQKEYDEQVASMTDQEVMELAGNLRNGITVATPAFDGATAEDIDQYLVKAGLDKSGQLTLFDGRTGEPFMRKVTVGYIYMMKLNHLVDDKIHARSTGPYSLVTQQPLGGKSMFGGQRLGEMEVWALEAYGAAYTLQEMLTVKSDDVTGRTKVYEAIVRGDDNFETGVPESFNVLVKEVRSLGLNIEAISESGASVDTGTSGAGPGAVKDFTATRAAAERALGGFGG
ncbi:DNA-directed RNA polymerase subunit beta [Alphaproteobacteria bacterium]|nr:DNA-directed RNA polymerase subunit beta [Alphaproteobacteria bacterium]